MNNTTNDRKIFCAWCGADLSKKKEITYIDGHSLCQDCLKKFANLPIPTLTCSKCGKTFTEKEKPLEYQEFILIHFTGGFSSVFGDESNITLDLCQHCFKELLSPYIRVNGKFI